MLSSFCIEIGSGALKLGQQCESPSKSILQLITFEGFTIL